MSRPIPSTEACDEIADAFFEPAQDLATWAADTFIASGATLQNPDHEFLESAQIGFLWTNVPNARQQRTVVGMAELGPPKPGQGKWVSALQEFQMIQWFGTVPDFKITLYAPFAASLPDIDFCALIEHELYHCHIQYKDGAPRFRKDGTPVWAIRGHDVEEHIGIVRRYGAGAGAGQAAEFVKAATQIPEVGRAVIARACGTCDLRLA